MGYWILGTGLIYRGLSDVWSLGKEFAWFVLF